MEHVSKSYTYFQNQTKSLFISMAVTDVLGAIDGIYLGYILLNNFDGSNYNVR